MKRRGMAALLLITFAASIVGGCNSDVPAGIANQKETAQTRTGGRKPEEIIQGIQNDPGLTEAQKKFRIDWIKQRNGLK